MANIYVRSTDGNNADDGSTWALAKATIAGAAAVDAAGDTIFLSDAHAESTAGAVAITLAGSQASPSRLLCGDDAAEPPTTIAATATITTTGANGITVSGWLYCYGVAFYCGTGGTSASVILCFVSGDTQTFEGCEFRIVNTGSSTAAIQCESDAAGAPGNLRWIDCDVRFAHANQGIRLERSTFEWRGGSILSGGTSPSNLFLVGGSSSRGVSAMVDGVDLSNGASTMNLVAGAQARAAKFVFRNCKMPGSWSGSLLSGTIGNATRAEMYNCDSADTNYKVWVEDYCGSVKDETTLVLTGGASDGTTTLAWKMATSADAEYPLNVLRSPEIASEFLTSTGSSKTATVEILHDSATALKDDEVWLEVEYMGTSGFPLALFASDAKANVLATAADQASSSATWTTTGLTNVNKQKLVATFTPQEQGVALVRVCVAKASYTLYVDPKVTIA